MRSGAAGRLRLPITLKINYLLTYLPALPSVGTACLPVGRGEWGNFKFTSPDHSTLRLKMFIASCVSSSGGERWQ